MLSNDQRYAVAVAGYDDLGNVGQLSDVVSETPRLDPEVWESPSRGCACSLQERVPTHPLAALLAAFPLAWARRRRRC